MSLSAYKTWIEADDQNDHQHHKACSTQENPQYGQADTICDFFSGGVNGGCFWGHCGMMLLKWSELSDRGCFGFQKIPFAKLAWQFQHSEFS